MTEPLTQIVPQPLTKPISVKIEQGTVSWMGSRVAAERITAYQDGKRVGRIVRRLVCKRQEIPDVPGKQARTFRVSNEEDR